jgi:hypothetical protein
MIRIAFAKGLLILVFIPALPALAQPQAQWPQCVAKPRCAAGSVATCVRVASCVIPNKRPHKGCLQYSCVKEPWKAREEERARSEKDKTAPAPSQQACTGGRVKTRSGCGCPAGKAFISGQCVLIDYGGAPQLPKRGPVVR